MKVVINAQYGGFSLSPAGVSALLEKKGKTAYHYVNARSVTGRAIDFDNFVRLDPDDEEAARLGIYYTFTEDKGDGFNKRDWKNDDDTYISSGRDTERHDPDLVAVVEELGEKANGAHATLKVVEVPDGVEYEVQEYDGIEWIAEKHRTWS